MSIIGSNFRLTGIASGLDTEKIVSDLMRVERIPLTKLEQQKQLAEWRQDAYREFTNALRGFNQKFFDVARPASYLLSDKAFKVLTATSASQEYVSVKGTSEAEVGSHTVKVMQLATADTAVSGGSVSKPITGEVTDFNLSGKSIRVTLDGVTREITLANYDDLDDLIGDATGGLQKLLDDAFGSGKIAVSNASGELQLSTEGGASKLTLYSGTADDGLASLGINSGASNRISMRSTLSDLVEQLNGTLTFDASGNVSFEINGAAFTFSEDDTLTVVMTAINNDKKANARMRYDEASDTFSITAKQTGAGDNIRISETAGTFFSSIGINASDPITIEGVDAIAVIDNVTVTRSTNTFTVNGIEYTLKNPHPAVGDGETITVEQDVDSVVDSIKSFVDEYNNLIDMFSTTLSEKYDRNYLPLSNEQKEAMTEHEIEKWENKAKTGLLRNDPILQEIQSSMRMALIDSVEGVGISLSSIGISSTSYLDKGKLTINEEKLKEAIRQRPDEVKSLFKQTSESEPNYTRSLTTSQRQTRYQEQGLLFRISDIIENNISIIRDSSGRKGTLLEKAGIEGDTSANNSTLARDIYTYNERISELLVKLVKKEENYYWQFSQLEKHMNQMNSQMDWLVSQLSAMS